MDSNGVEHERRLLGSWKSVTSFLVQAIETTRGQGNGMQGWRITCHGATSLGLYILRFSKFHTFCTVIPLDLLVWQAP